MTDLYRLYFPELEEGKLKQLDQLEPLYREWNARINVISRKDIDNLPLHHVLHSLSIAKVIRFQPRARILDIGTGGGFPGIPLAILFPDTQFMLVDSIGKKVKVCEAVAAGVGLTNVTCRHIRAEELKEKFDMVVSRAVAPIDQLARWSHHLIRRENLHAMPNGIFALKGGDPKEEIKLLRKGDYWEVFPLDRIFRESYFHEKYLLYLQH